MDLIWSVYLIKMIINFINTLALKTLILQLSIVSVYLIKMIINFINTLALKTLILQLSMKCLPD